MDMLLDTNVVSALIHKSPDRIVEKWSKSFPLEKMFFSAVGEAELRYGAATLPLGRRREALISSIENMLRNVFKDRILPFDSDAAHTYAAIAAERRSKGRPVMPFDCQIAAIARSRNMAVATRNVRDFENAGIEIVDPWKTT